MSQDTFGFTPEDVQEDLGYIERLLSGTSSTDEYLEAILRAQLAQLRTSGERDISRMDTVNGIPEGTAGVCAQATAEGDVGSVVFNVDGRSVVETIQAVSNIEKEEVVVVDTDQGGVRPVSDVDQSYLGLGSIDFSTQTAGGFKVYETPNKVTISPGDEETVLKVDVAEPAGISRVGTNDETYSRYIYLVDGNEVMNQPLFAPLGLYNDMYEFRRPLKITESFEVRVKRLSSANGVSDYYSNAVVVS